MKKPNTKSYLISEEKSLKREILDPFCDDMKFPLYDIESIKGYIKWCTGDHRYKTASVLLNFVESQRAEKQFLDFLTKECEINSENPLNMLCLFLGVFTPEMVSFFDNHNCHYKRKQERVGVELFFDLSIKGSLAESLLNLICPHFKLVGSNNGDLFPLEGGYNHQPDFKIGDIDIELISDFTSYIETYGRKDLRYNKYQTLKELNSLLLIVDWKRRTLRCDRIDKFKCTESRDLKYGHKDRNPNGKGYTIEIPRNMKTYNLTKQGFKDGIQKFLV